MSAQGPYAVTEQFEKALCDYTGAPFSVAVDNCSNAIRLCLLHELAVGNLKLGDEISIPNRTYMSVPCEIRLAGLRVKWMKLPASQYHLCGDYNLKGTRIVDSSLLFTADMWYSGSVELCCLSFTGPYKNLKLGKGGAILMADAHDYLWFKKARFSGRDECSYHEDDFTMLGHNFYMEPEKAARGLILMQQFYNLDGSKKHNEPISLPYPDLSKFPVYTDPLPWETKVVEPELTKVE